ncbi:YhcN/YlaJ family sporulation lipoprotein [Numidum massiliense]|uniref:YhcN/YlaJ family sporulation lipoprotein n=1 Tax=Numidum massiliense TaxID=1522315 RepID=UPI0006D54D1C|nr:YhcN/YlaJ family sporulation lipoprotein [Numidum massiliense]
MKKRRVIGLCTFLLCFSLAACSVGPETEQIGERTSKRVSYRWNDGDNNYARQNPNIRVGNPTPTTLNNDGRRMKLAAESVDGVAKANVYIVGGNALIGLTIDRSESRARALAIEDDVRRQLRALMPRYAVYVTSSARSFLMMRGNFR